MLTHFLKNYEIARSEFKHGILSSTEWVGAIECTAMLRYFSIRAVVVNFCPGSDSIDQRMKTWVKKYFNIMMKHQQSIHGSNEAERYIHPLILQHEGHSRWPSRLLKHYNPNKTLT